MNVLRALPESDWRRVKLWLSIVLVALFSFCTGALAKKLVGEM